MFEMNRDFDPGRKCSDDEENQKKKNQPNIQHLFESQLKTKTTIDPGGGGRWGRWVMQLLTQLNSDTLTVGVTRPPPRPDVMIHSPSHSWLRVKPDAHC